MLDVGFIECVEESKMDGKFKEALYRADNHDQQSQSRHPDVELYCVERGGRGVHTKTALLTKGNNLLVYHDLAIPLNKAMTFWRDYFSDWMSR